MGIRILGKFIPKITNFGDFGGCKPTFKSYNGYIWHEGAGLAAWESLSKPNFYKNRLRAYSFWANLYQKITNFGNFEGCKPKFKKLQWLNLARGCGPASRSPTPNFEEIAKGDIPFGETLYHKNTNFSDFGACKPTFLKPQPWSLAWSYGPGTPSPIGPI